MIVFSYYILLEIENIIIIIILLQYDLPTN
jgi:hypothetical protein